MDGAEVGNSINKYKVPLVIGGGVLVGLYLLYSNSASSTASSTTSGSTAADEAAYEAALASQSSTAAQLQAVQVQSGAATSQEQIAATASTQQAQIDANAATAGGVLSAYSSVQQAAFNYANNAQAINAGIAEDYMANQTTQQANNLSATVANNTNNLEAADYALSQYTGLLQNQNANQAYVYSNQAAALSQQAMSGTQAVAGANQVANQTAPTFSGSFAYGPIQASGSTADG